MTQFQISNPIKRKANYSKKAFTKSVKMVIAVTVNIMLFSGCINYYKINSAENITTVNKAQINDAAKHKVVHFKDNTFALKNASVNENTLAGRLVPLTAAELNYLDPSSRSKNKYKKSDRDFVLNQVDIYAETINVPDNMQIAIPTASITRIGINEKNKGATTGSHFWVQV